MDNPIKDSIRSISWIEKLLCFLIPQANPDFDNYIRRMKYWFLEFKDEVSLPNREIGLDENNIVVMKMPFKNNYGFWIDNNLTLTDFKESFEIEHISKEFFEEKWKTIN